MDMKSIIFLLALCVLPARVWAQDALKSTREDQTQIAVTVYNSNLALVKESRALDLKQGKGELRFMDVAAYIIPESVHIKAVKPGQEFMVLEQNYEYDLMNQNKLMDKYVGQNLQILDANPYQDRKDLIDAHLLSNNDHQPVYKIGDKIYLGHPGIPVLPEIPENLIAQPTLTWLFENSTPVDLIEVSYLTTNMNWKADYVLALNEDDTLADLSAWVTIDNQSGAAYDNAALKLIAGEVHRAQALTDKAEYMEERVMMKSTGAPFVEKQFFEYHIYDLNRKTTLKDRQTKQISLLESKGIKILKEYTVYGNKTQYNRQYYEENPKQPVNVNVKFRNDEQNHLGMPLPKGIVRLYKEDDQASLQFVGEDSIEHTPKDEDVSLKVGEAFDIVAEKRQTEFKNITTRMIETGWEIKLKNHKDQDVTVAVIEPLNGDWSVVMNSHPYKKLDAFTIRFDIPVPKDQTVTVTYTARIGY